MSGAPTRGASPPALVAHRYCASHERVAAALDDVVAPFGGWSALVQPGERIAVKVNLLRAATPESAVCTNPATLLAVLRALKAAGAEPFVADSPGGRSAPARIARAFKLSGLTDVCLAEGVPIVDVGSERATLEAPGGRLYRSFPVGAAFTRADAIIQVGIVKTHQLMRLTGGVKLTFGCISGLTKSQLHVRASRRDDFADMLIDLHQTLRPRFTIMDGIIAMEGQGPGSGTPRRLNSLFAAVDCHALDAALADRTGIARRSIYTLAAAERRGLVDLEQPYEAVGDPVVAEQGFRPASGDLYDRLPESLQRFARNQVAARPRLVDEAACTRCGDCAGICGAKAIQLRPTPVFDNRRCVRCYACTEVCPTAAIDNVAPPAARLLGQRG